MIEKIHKLIEEAEAFSTQSLEELEAFRIKFLGKKGLLTDLFAQFKEVPNEQKKDFGQSINNYIFNIWVGLSQHTLHAPRNCVFPIKNGRNYGDFHQLVIYINLVILDPMAQCRK